MKSNKSTNSQPAALKELKSLLKAAENGDPSNSDNLIAAKYFRYLIEQYKKKSGIHTTTLH